MAKKRKTKRKPSATKRIGSALSGWLKRQNPGKWKGVKHARVKKNRKTGAITIMPIPPLTYKGIKI